MWESTIHIERSEGVHSEPSQLWSLLSSPAAWSLLPDLAFMFGVPETPSLRFYIGRTPRGTGSVLFEIVDEKPGEMLRLRTLPTGRQEYTLAATAGRRGTAKASVQVKQIVPRQQKIEYERKRRNDVKRWLSALRAVAEGRARQPGEDMAVELRQACTARLNIPDPQSTSASTVINADPSVVWDAIESPETALRVGTTPAVYSGYVPGTPRGVSGEMQYFLQPRSDGLLEGNVVVVAEVAQRRSALTHTLGGPVQLEQSYLLTPESESGPTRLEITYRWPAPKLAGPREIVKSRMSEALQCLVTDYKSLIESPPSAPAPTA